MAVLDRVHAVLETMGDDTTIDPTQLSDGSSLSPSHHNHSHDMVTEPTSSNERDDALSCLMGALQEKEWKKTSTDNQDQDQDQEKEWKKTSTDTPPMALQRLDEELRAGLEREKGMRLQIKASESLKMELEEQHRSKFEEQRLEMERLGEALSSFEAIVAEQKKQRVEHQEEVELVRVESRRLKSELERVRQERNDTRAALHETGHGAMDSLSKAAKQLATSESLRCEAEKRLNDLNNEHEELRKELAEKQDLSRLDEEGLSELEASEMGD